MSPNDLMGRGGAASVNGVGGKVSLSENLNMTAFIVAGPRDAVLWFSEFRHQPITSMARFWCTKASTINLLSVTISGMTSLGVRKAGFRYLVTNCPDKERERLPLHAAEDLWR